MTTELTREALAVAISFMTLPGNERQQFADAIVERATDWAKCSRLRGYPPVWPIALRVERAKA